MPNLIDSAEIVGRNEVEIAISALVDIAQAGPPEQRLRAAEMLLNYGVRSPWMITADSEPTE